MLEYLNKYEKLVYYTLSILLAFVIFFAVLELIWLIISGLFNETGLRLDNYEILNLFGFFLLILIGIELLDTIKAYITKHEIHVEVIVLLAIIAVARKIILLDPLTTGESQAVSDIALIGLGVIVIALAGAYYLIRKSGISQI
ncbi:uncharacterized membrane protein (DUF373 family) [Methanolinea mesophila]|uniref:phosphate-starvation-inducible PsiE family protein n=1 Tax=Methanolinea mesophila TaxID=547055 RepID=UPI001AE579B1|nr:phosphate-starvation-inducible PsiE family protein [Methanolinea mesophila]MBP1927570.1 uncharacterized membrane protein (DUF373 family) [Methanolinea mesophila]